MSLPEAAFSTSTSYQTSILGSWVEIPKAATDPEKDFPIPEIAPKNAIHHRLLGKIDNKINLQKSSHVVHHLTILSGKDKGKKGFYKLCDQYYPPKLVQYESGTSGSYRIPRMEKAAEVRPVVDDEGHIIGSLSLEIPKFKPMSNGTYTPQELLKFGAPGSLVARYVREEDDNHPDNRGISEDLGFVDIDFDMSWYPLTYVIKGGARLINGIVTPLPHRAFPITDRDDDNFPVLTDSQGCYNPAYPPKNGNILRQDINMINFQKLKELQDFHLQKNYAFLLELLIPPKTHRKIIKLSFSKKPEDKVSYNELVDHIRERYLQLERNKINKNTFRKYIVKHNGCIQKVIQHFKEYNDKIATYGVVFDLDEIKNRFDILLKKCFIKDLTQVLLNIRMSFENHYNTDVSFTKTFNDIINICINFEEMNASLSSTFLGFKQEITHYMELIDTKMKAAWIRHSMEFSQVIENYQSAVFGNQMSLEQSVIMPTLKRAISISKEKDVEPEITVAHALKNWLSDHRNINRIIEIVKEAYETYKPVEFLGFSPMSVFRDRKGDFEQLLKDLEGIKTDHYGEIPSGIIARHIVKFTKDGAWNQDVFYRGGSANVLLIDQLSLATLDDFKNHLSLRQLKQQDLINVFLIIQSKKSKLQPLAQKIADHLEKLL